jgi:hypothetical protein
VPIDDALDDMPHAKEVVIPKLILPYGFSNKEIKEIIVNNHMSICMYMNDLFREGSKESEITDCPIFLANDSAKIERKKYSISLAQVKCSLYGRCEVWSIWGYKNANR